MPDAKWLASSIEARASRPEERILGLFHALHDRFATEGYYGCAFIRASIEYPSPDHPVHRAAREHKEMIRSYLRGLATEVEGADPVSLPEQLYLLVEGAITPHSCTASRGPPNMRGKQPKLLIGRSIESNPTAKRSGKLSSAGARR